jgi:flagellar basal-body rod protein FlgB
MELFDVTEKALEVALHGSELRQQVISNNLANVNTPGFKRSDVEFTQQLAEALQFNATDSSRRP